MNTPGKNIKTLRQQKGWSQGKVAEQLGISIPAFSKIETGITDMNLSRLKQIADLFEVPVLIIVSGEDSTRASDETEIELLKNVIVEKNTEIADLQQKVIKLYEELRRL